ncbi:hypothetical protein V8C44DRAFT_335139 [Trichoderma aethiopicum]
MAMVRHLFWVMQVLRTWTSRLGAPPFFSHPRPETTRWAFCSRYMADRAWVWRYCEYLVRIDLLHYSLVEKWTAGRDSKCRLAEQRGIIVLPVLKGFH